MVPEELVREILLVCHKFNCIITKHKMIDLTKLRAQGELKKQLRLKEKEIEKKELEERKIRVKQDKERYKKALEKQDPIEIAELEQEAVDKFVTAGKKEFQAMYKNGNNTGFFRYETTPFSIKAIETKHFKLIHPGDESTALWITINGYVKDEAGVKYRFGTISLIDASELDAKINELIVENGEKGENNSKEEKKIWGDEITKTIRNWFIRKEETSPGKKTS